MKSELLILHAAKVDVKDSKGCSYPYAHRVIPVACGSCQLPNCLVVSDDLSGDN